ncbi:Protein of unknown function [Bacillus mycoides]|uniref:Uncharacterized protein n=1 Tax=Bacillus mycoides TaxID=1405 RepID=A0A1G4ERP9_BACMY|nr:Protein of unknown function [Bacillus mycoides]
MIVDYAGEG